MGVVGFGEINAGKVSEVVFCRVLTNRTRGIYPGHYPTTNFCKFYKAIIPVSGTSVSSVK